MSSSTARISSAVAAYGLNGCGEAPVLGEMPTDPWSEMLATVSHQRLTGLLWRMVQDQAAELPDRRIDEVRGLQESAMVLSVQLELELLDLVELFDERGIDYRVLKGPSYARMHYGDPSLRPFGDIDLMVRGEQIDAVVEIMEGMGGTRRYAEPRPGFIARFGKGACVINAHDVEVDLHRTLSVGPFGMALDPELMFERRSLFPLGGRLVAAPDAEARFFHACYHAALGGPIPRLLALRDVLQMALRLDLDIDRLERIVILSRAQVVITTALSMATGMLGVAIDPELDAWTRRLSSTRRERRWLELYRGERRSSARLTLASLGAMNRPADRIAYLRAVVFPEASRYGSWTGRWRAGLASLRASVGTR